MTTDQPADKLKLGQRVNDAIHVVRGTKSVHTPAPASAKPASRLDLAERAYKEVLDATKHQDDKVGRFLTAIAFLTTGAIALIANSGDGPSNLARDFKTSNGSSEALLAWSTGAFIAFTLGSVALLLLCLSVPVRLPKSPRDPMDRSHLFYTYIAGRPRSQWLEMWKRTDATGNTLHDLEEAITDDYVRESHNLAERTGAKYRHSYEASWLFVCALLFLGISIFLRLLAELDSSGDTVTFKTRHVFVLAAIVSLHALLQVYTRTVHDIRSMEKVHDGAYVAYATKHWPKAQVAKIDLDQQRRAAIRANAVRTMGLAIAPIGVSFAAAFPTDGRSGAAIAAAAAALATFIGLWAVRDMWDDSKPDTETDADQFRIKPSNPRAYGPPAVWAAAAAALIATVHLVEGPWRILAVPLPVLVLGLISTARPARSHRGTRKRVAKAATEQAKADTPVTRGSKVGAGGPKH